jgi:hypothetical protein
MVLSKHEFDGFRSTLGIFDVHLTVSRHFKTKAHSPKAVIFATQRTLRTRIAEVTSSTNSQAGVNVSPFLETPLINARAAALIISP